MWWRRGRHFTSHSKVKVRSGNGTWWKRGKLFASHSKVKVRWEWSVVEERQTFHFTFYGQGKVGMECGGREANFRFTF